MSSSRLTMQKMASIKRLGLVAFSRTNWTRGAHTVRTREGSVRGCIEMSTTKSTEDKMSEVVTKPRVVEKVRTFSQVFRRAIMRLMSQIWSRR